MPYDPSSEVKFEIGHVLFIDIVGYSKLLINEQSEQVEKLREIARATEQIRLAEAEGKLLRLPTGDGGALVFRTTPEAPVLCAVEISQALRSHPELRVRMGIHSGPVNEVTGLNEQANIAGAGINIAQRVMDCGDAGHILLSRRVAEDLEHYHRWRPYLHSLGEIEIKHGDKISVVNFYQDELGNPAVPQKFTSATKEKMPAAVIKPSGLCLRRWIIGVLIGTAVVFGVLALLKHQRQSMPASNLETSRPYENGRPGGASLPVPEKSIAVLPFESLSEDTSNAYFAEGVQDEILTRLAKVADLKVISRTSTQHFKSTPENLPQIARELGVTNILEGSVQKVKNQVRVNVQLINALSDSHLWAEIYDRELTDIFSVESDIAKSIADALQARLTGTERNELSKKPTESAAAYELYLKGRFFWNKRTSSDMKTALGYFEQAANVDPNYAVAYAGMADCYLLLPLYGGGVPTEMYPKAISMAQKAIALDPNLGEPHASLGLVHALFDFDFPASVREFEEAIRLNPNYALAHHWFGDSVLPALGEFDRANAEAKRALELDPLSIVNITDTGTVYWITGRYQEAVTQFKKAIEMDPRNYAAHWGFGQALERVGDLPGAIAEYEKSTQLDDDPLPLGLLGAAKAKAGDRTGALAILDKLQAIAKQRYVPDYSFALIHLALGQKDEAMKWLESSYAKHQPDLNWVRVDPDLRPLHGDARFEALAEKIVPATEFKGSIAFK
jgi:TolB-like protein/Flp pilus assembly protein TadD